MEVYSEGSLDSTVNKARTTAIAAAVTARVLTPALRLQLNTNLLANPTAALLRMAKVNTDLHPDRATVARRISKARRNTANTLLLASQADTTNTVLHLMEAREANMAEPLKVNMVSKEDSHTGSKADMANRANRANRVDMVNKDTINASWIELVARVYWRQRFVWVGLG